MQEDQGGPPVDGTLDLLSGGTHGRLVSIGQINIFNSCQSIHPIGQPILNFGFDAEDGCLLWRF
jgi:hypothetical protein